MRMNVDTSFSIYREVCLLSNSSWDLFVIYIKHCCAHFTTKQHWSFIGFIEWDDDCYNTLLVVTDTYRGVFKTNLKLRIQDNGHTDAIFGYKLI